MGAVVRSPQAATPRYGEMPNAPPSVYPFIMTTTHKAKRIDGKALAAAVKDDVRTRVAALRELERPVRLDAILASDDPAAALYARNQASNCEKLGIEYVLHELPADSTFQDIAGRVLLLNADDDVHAIMVHLPLPEPVDTEQIQALIDVDKDVEGVNPANIGRVVYGQRSLIPCTALAVIEMIESTGIQLQGARCVCVGASNIVGKPVAVLLMQTDATVISTNIFTHNITELTSMADVLVTATGRPELIRSDWVKPGAVVIDVGIHQLEEGGQRRTVGDVAFDEVAEIAGAISPVPGGVGPMTVAMLLRNTVESAER